MKYEIPTREQQIEKLKQDHLFDILVIGGGSTGAGNYYFSIEINEK